MGKRREKDVRQLVDDVHLEMAVMEKDLDVVWNTISDAQDVVDLNTDKELARHVRATTLLIERRKDRTVDLQKMLENIMDRLPEETGTSALTHPVTAGS